MTSSFIEPSGAFSFSARCSGDWPFSSTNAAFRDCSAYSICVCRNSIASLQDQAGSVYPHHLGQI